MNKTFLIILILIIFTGGFLAIKFLKLPNQKETSQQNKEETLSGNLSGIKFLKPSNQKGASQQNKEETLSGNLSRINFVGKKGENLTLENGEIKAGDRIALSSVPGVGMKATTSGQTIGIALENFSGSMATSTDGTITYDRNVVGKIRVFVNSGYSKIDSQIAAGEIVLDGVAESSFWGIDESSGRIKFIGALDINDFDIINVKAIRGWKGLWSIDENGVLTAKEVHTEKLCIGETCITENDLKEFLKLKTKNGSPVDSVGPPPAETPPTETSTALETPPADSTGSPPADSASTSSDIVSPNMAQDAAAAAVEPAPAATETTPAIEPNPTPESTLAPEQTTIAETPSATTNSE